MEGGPGRWGDRSVFVVDGPTYRHPPVVETSLGVHFAPISNWKANIFGLFQARVRERYPRFDSAPPVAWQMQTGPFPNFSVSISQIPKIRGLYLDADQNSLIQIQDDFFFVNWRKAANEDSYPRYRTLRLRFLDEWDSFNQFLAENNLFIGPIAQCQVNYVNVVEVNGDLTAADICTDLSVSGLLGERIQFAAQYHSEDIELNYQLVPGIRVQDNRDVMQFTLTASTSKLDPMGGDLINRFDATHRVLVEFFERLTSKRAKNVWGRQE